jgi:predicted DsbA family dithiol-disulfide isomerase
VRGRPGEVLGDARPHLRLEGYAREIGLDGGKWEDCYDNNRHAGTIEANKQEGIRRQVGSTPTFFIGDRKISGAVPYDEIKAFVDSARAAAGVATAAPAAATPAPDSARR